MPDKRLAIAWQLPGNIPVIAGNDEQAIYRRSPATGTYFSSNIFFEWTNDPADSR